jgi:hypothetical protein
LDGLEKLSFGLNRGRDDDLGLLKFGNIASANITHASRDCADQILAAIVNLCRPKENLL